MISLFEADTSRDFCEKCGLHKKCKSPFMKTGGKGEKQLMVIAEAPGATEDEKNDQLVGDAGRKLEDIFAKFGFSLHEDFWKENSVCCRPVGNKTPSKKQFECCNERLMKAIKKHKPKAVLIFGDVAVSAVLGKRRGKAALSSIDGLKIPYHDLGCWVLPLFHPSYILRNEYDKNLISHWEKTIKSALEFCSNLPKLSDYKVSVADNVNMCTTFKEVENTFDIIKTNGKEFAVAIDYETSGIDMYQKEHKIFSVGIAIEGHGSFSFPLDHPRSPWTDEEYFSIEDMLKEFLTSQNGFKIAHNAFYETNVSRNILGVVPKIDWCTMTTQHVIDTRPGITGLKFQAFARWGLSYADETKKYIKDCGDGFNNMDKQPLHEQLLYVGTDAYLTLKLFMEQEKEIVKTPGLKFSGVDFFNDAVHMLEEVTHNGLRIDEDYIDEQAEGIDEEVKEIEEEIFNSKEVKGYLKDTGLKEFDIDSTTKLSPFFYDYLKLPVKYKTAKSENPAADEKALTEMNNWISDEIISRRKLLKIKDTYLEQLKNNSANGWIHPNFNLQIARTLRSSASGPSIQNYPKRNEEAKKYARSGIFPKEGHIFMEADFSGIEVSTSAIYHQDPTFINYLKDEHSDMHRDNTGDLFLLTEEEITKMLRFYGKNGWTFPEFYGDYFGSCAINLWKNCCDLQIYGSKLSIRDHLRSKTFIRRFEESKLVKVFMKEGIKKVREKDVHLVHEAVNTIQKIGVTNLETFKQYCRMVEYYMWYVRFPVYTEWKEKCQKDYQKKGYVETFFGFIFGGYLDKKQVTNYPIQSTAFHLLLWSMIQLSNIRKKERWKSFFMGEIHDSMLVSVHPKELEHVKERILYVCTKKIIKEFPWINVPYKIDIEYTEVNQSWNDLK